LNDVMGGVPLKINSKTGEITATPNLVGQFLAGVCVEEYRNGVLMSIVRRDFQFNVRVCSQPPLAQFTTNESNCDGLSVEFFNTSLSASAFQWDFNFPSTDPTFKSTEKNPVFTFPTIGTYNVRLRVTRGSDGCFDTLIQKVTIFNNRISPDFNFKLSDCNNITDSLKIKLSDISTFDEPGFVINKWEWTVVQNGRTQSYTGKNPDVNLSNTGDVTVTLQVGANNDCKSTVTKSIKISEILPALDFKLEYVACPVNDILQFRLINLSSAKNPFATITATRWMVGNTTLVGDSALINIPYTADSVLIKLTTDFDGCTSQLSRKIKLLAPPAASFSVASGICAGLSVRFANNSSNGDNFRWNFNYPSPEAAFISQQKDPTFIYSSSGKYKVQLIVTRAVDGCQDTILQEIGVYENKITPDFTIKLSDCSVSQSRLTLFLNDISKTNELGANVIKWEWTITQNGINQTFTTANPEVNLSYSGDITTKLQVSTDNGCMAEITKIIQAGDIVPELDFKIEYASCPINNVLQARLINLSAAKNPFATIKATRWLVGNAALVGDSALINIPYTTDSIQVRLQADFDGLCTAELIKKFQLLAPPKAAFSVTSDVCTGCKICR
jgi:PKD repeat protein